MGEHETDPDDVQSIIRFFAYANYFDIEALVASAGTHANKASTEGFTAILGLYAKVEANLKKHDPEFPSAEAMTKVVYKGRDGTWGIDNDLVGDGKDTDASNAIIAVVDKADTRPVWIVIWGGPVEVAQALYKVKKERTADEADKFVSKMRVFDIMGQDGSHKYMIKTFPKLFHILSHDFGGMFCDNDRGDKALCNTAWLDANIKSKGPLNAVYPVNCSMVKGGVQEGDSPSFMHLISSVHPKGTKNNPEDPTMDSWGGKYKKVGDSNFYEDSLATKDWKNVRAHHETVQKDWAERAAWMVP
jgi:hypothetical protein